MKKNYVTLLFIVIGTFLHNHIIANEVIVIGASPTPHAAILKQVQPILKKQGIDLQIKELNDYVTPNLLLSQNQLDANFFQHRPYLKQFNKEHGTNLVELASVEIEPMGIFVNKTLPSLQNFLKTKTLSKLPKGLIISIPNDTTNEGRALLLLQSYHFITLKKNVEFPTKKDIMGNPYDLEFKELEAPMLPRVLKTGDTSIAVINANFALLAGLSPIKDAIFIETNNSPYVNIIAVKKEDVNLPKFQKLKSAINSPAINTFIKKQYKEAIIPTFK